MKSNPLSFLCRISFLILFINVAISQDDEFDSYVAVELQMSDFDLSDSYDEISQVTKAALLGQHGLGDRVIAEKERGKLMREQSAKNREFESNVPYHLMRNWTLLTKMGDLLLPESDLNSLIEFRNVNEELANLANVSCPNNSSNCAIGKEDVAEFLATNRNPKDLEKAWSSWQEVFEETRNDFQSNLRLVDKAFVPNEEHSARSYWEMLSEYEDGYAKAQTLWEEVQPLYKKLHEFVKVRLYNYYKIEGKNGTAIPVYLLGDNFGADWTNVAEIVLPHPYLYHEIRTELKYQTVKDIYKLAENVTGTLGLGALGKKFWTMSDFNSSSCGPHVFSDCGQHYSEILTCDGKLGWKEYLDIHEASMEVALRNQDYSSLPRQELRFSAVDEALKGLSSILAVDNLPFYDFVPRNAFTSEKNEFNRKDTALLLLALRVLPKLPYYLLADSWRLEELEFSYGNCTEKWWSKRKEVQGVMGSTNLEPDFLGDSHVISNKPYLSKFLGVFLQFELADYYRRHFGGENGSLAQFIGNDANFKGFVFDRPNKKWTELLDFQYSFTEVSSAPLLEHFRPLEEYMEKAPLKQVVISTTAKPRTTKRTGKPTKKRSKDPNNRVLKPDGTAEKNNNGSETLQLQNDQGQGSKKEIKNTETTTEAAPPDETKKGKMGVILGVVGVICVGLVLIVVVRRLRRRQKTNNNNRRFET